MKCFEYVDDVQITIGGILSNKRVRKQKWFRINGRSGK